MKRLVLIALTAALSGFLISCSQVPLTGRQQLNLVGDSQINQMSSQAYEQFLDENKDKVVKAGSDLELVRTVGNRIKTAVEDYMSANGLYHEIAGFNWEFNLIDDEQANAWAMPGGKIVVYKGILQHTQNDDGLAVVMAHEIAHVVAKHGSERMSQGMLLQLGGSVIQEYGASEVFLTAFSIGTTYGFQLPYSRKHEYEADHLGLIFMTMAGYDPAEAPRFWQRMSGAGAASIPEFMSTHPHAENRIARLNQLLPEMEQYKP